MVNKGLLHADGAVAVLDGTILAGGLPVPFLGGTVCPGTVSILSVKHTEEVPFQVPGFQLRLTGKIPGLELVDVDEGDRVDPEGFPDNLALEVEPNELFIGRVESEAGSERG